VLARNVNQAYDQIEYMRDVEFNAGDIVADFFMGSGSTGDVSLELSRKFIGCDTGEKACKLTQKRLEKYT
jgi:DNA modification methylase